MYKGKVLRVIDGDTLEAAIEMWPDITVLARVRVMGVDCPETKGETAREGYYAKRFTYEEVQDMECSFTVFGKDSFGRVLCSVQYLGKDLATELIKHGYGKEYGSIKATSGPRT